jgi:hypothetical protein
VRALIGERGAQAMEQIMAGVGATARRQARTTETQDTLVARVGDCSVNVSGGPFLVLFGDATADRKYNGMGSFTRGELAEMGAALLAMLQKEGVLGGALSRMGTPPLCAEREASLATLAVPHLSA